MFLPSLPEPSGPYPVTATTFVRRIPKPAPVGKSLIRRGGQLSEPTLLFEEVAFTVFAPTADYHSGWLSGWLGPKKGVDWISKPAHETVKGYFEYGRGSFSPWLETVSRLAAGLYARRLKIPAYPNTPLRPPASDQGSWPLAVFSHGLAGARTTYSAICTRLASQGRVVLAMEHRDGTGPAVFPNERTLLYINPDDLEWPGEPPVSPGPWNSAHALRFRRDQLDFRRGEVYEAVRSFSQMVGGAEDRGGLEVMDGELCDWESWTGKVDTSKVDLVGHSFGGATIFSILANPPPPLPNSTEKHAHLPINRVLLLDPWMEPFASPGPEPYTNPSSPSPAEAPELLVINSEGFTLWTNHLDLLEKTMLRFSPSRLVTILRSQHISFSDFPLIIPSWFRSVDPVLMLNRTGLLMDRFLSGKLALRGSHLGVEDDDGITVRELDFIKNEETGKRRLDGEPGDIALH